MAGLGTTLIRRIFEVPTVVRHRKKAGERSCSWPAGLRSTALMTMQWADDA